MAKKRLFAAQIHNPKIVIDAQGHIDRTPVNTDVTANTNDTIEWLIVNNDSQTKKLKLTFTKHVNGRRYSPIDWFGFDDDDVVKGIAIGPGKEQLSGRVVYFPDPDVNNDGGFKYTISTAKDTYDPDLEVAPPTGHGLRKARGIRKRGRAKR
jgi:hypothetical protein